jgi:Flp pilus assembly pilin Flp
MNLMKFLKDEEGQSMVEYGVTLGAVAAVSYISVVALGDKTGDLYAWMANHLPGGEGEEAGVNQQVRNGIDGLVSLDEANIGGVTQLTMTSAPEAMNTTLGSSNVYGATEGWNVQ